MKTLSKTETTPRGFEVIRFKDGYGVQCSVQASSMFEREKPGTSALWIGPDDVNAQVMASEASQVGIETEQKTGWVPYPIPKNVSLHTRAHLNRDQVEALINHLQSWLDTDSLKP